MIYGFREVLPSGKLAAKVIDFEVSHEDVVGIGQRMRRGDREYQRIVEVPAMKVEGNFHFRSSTAPRFWTEHLKRGGKCDERGRPLFESKKQVVELNAVGADSPEGLRHEGIFD